jgi:hypothetical protein
MLPPKKINKKKSIQDMIEVKYDFTEKNQGVIKKDNVNIKPILPKQVQQEEKKEYKKNSVLPVQPMLSQDKSTPKEAKERKEAFDKVVRPSNSQLLMEGLTTLPLMYLSNPVKAVGHVLQDTPLGNQLGNFDKDLETIRTLRYRPGTEKQKKEDRKNLSKVRNQYTTNAFINAGLLELGYLSPNVSIPQHLLKSGSISNLMADGLQTQSSLSEGNYGDAAMNMLSMTSKLDNFDASNARKLIFNPSSLSKADKIDALKDLVNLGFAGQQQTQRTDPNEEELIKHSYGTNSQGIMKNKMNPRKKYANGTNAKGMDPANYIISPAQAMNDYNIMLGKAEAEAVSNPWLPIVAMAGQALQTGIGIAGGMTGAGNIGENTDLVSKTKGNKIIKNNTATGKNINASAGGGQYAAMGMNNVQGDVEVEGGEMYETPQGQVGEFQGPNHEQGGIPLEVGEDVEEGTKVYSDRLKVGNKTLAERKASREKQITNLEKIAQNGLADVAVKNAAKRKMEAIQKEEMQDLQFQEQVNNMQTMADTMVMAFGTGIQGIQEYGMGTSADGVYVNGTDPTGIRRNRFKKNPYTDAENYDKDGIKNFHDALGMDPKTPGYGKVLGPKTRQAYGEFAADYMHKQGYPTATPKWGADEARYMKDGKLFIKTEGEANALGISQEGQKYVGPDVPFLEGQDFSGGIGFDPTQPSFEGADAFAMTAGEDWAKANPLPQGIAEPMPTDLGFTPQFPIAESAEATATAKKPGAFSEALKEMSIPGVGDMTKLIGNYLGMTSGIKTAAEQRSTDVTHTNVFANVGKESQRLLDNAKQGIETSKAQAVVKASDVSRGGKRGARGSARGVNQMRAMDWLYDTALQEQIAQISANAAGQISQIDTQKSGVAMSADQLKGQGEFQAAMANEAAKDAYYTALGQGRKDFATGMQQTGKDVNAMSQNKIIENLMKEYGEFLTVDSKGNIKVKSNTKK